MTVFESPESSVAVGSPPPPSPFSELHPARLVTPPVAMIPAVLNSCRRSILPSQALPHKDATRIPTKWDTAVSCHAFDSRTESFVVHEAGGQRTDSAPFRCFTAYKLLVGYLFVQKTGSSLGRRLQPRAIALHFLLNDYGQTNTTTRCTHTQGWLLTASVPAGSAIGFAYHVPEHLMSVLHAFLVSGLVPDGIEEGPRRIMRPHRRHRHLHRGV